VYKPSEFNLIMGSIIGACCFITSILVLEYQNHGCGAIEMIQPQLRDVQCCLKIPQPDHGGIVERDILHFASSLSWSSESIFHHIENVHGDAVRAGLLVVLGKTWLVHIVDYDKVGLW